MLWKMVWNFLKKLNTELPYYPAIPPLGVYPGKWKRDVHRKLYTNIHTSIVHNIQQVETIQQLLRDKWFCVVQNVSSVQWDST